MMLLVEETKKESLELSVKAPLSLGAPHLTKAGPHCTRLLRMATNQLFDCFSTEEPPSML